MNERSMKYINHIKPDFKNHSFEKNVELYNLHGLLDDCIEVNIIFGTMFEQGARIWNELVEKEEFKNVEFRLKDNSIFYYLMSKLGYSDIFSEKSNRGLEKSKKFFYKYWKNESDDSYVLATTVMRVKDYIRFHSNESFNIKLNSNTRYEFFIGLKSKYNYAILQANREIIVSPDMITRIVISNICFADEWSSVTDECISKYGYPNQEVSVTIVKAEDYGYVQVHPEYDKKVHLKDVECIEEYLKNADFKKDESKEEYINGVIVTRYKKETESIEQEKLERCEMIRVLRELKRY